jgi:hypothetical protein
MHPRKRRKRMRRKSRGIMEEKTTGNIARWKEMLSERKGKRRGSEMEREKEMN